MNENQCLIASDRTGYGLTIYETYCSIDSQFIVPPKIWIETHLHLLWIENS